MTEHPGLDGFTVDPDADAPPFEQLRGHLAALVAAGDLPAGTRLDTVRAAAARLGLAVNTVARAYRELEADGVVVTEGRRGTFVRSGVVGSTSEVAVAAREAAAAYVDTARRLGLGQEEAIRLLQQGWAVEDSR